MRKTLQRIWIEKQNCLDIVRNTSTTTKIIFNNKEKTDLKSEKASYEIT